MQRTAHFMPTPTLDRLHLMQWLSPAFPVGGYAYSQGLEQAITDGNVTCADTVHDWVRCALCFGTGRVDGIFLVHARDPQTDVAALGDLAFAYAGSAERWGEMRDQGLAFGQTVGALTGEMPPALPYAVAVGHATRRLALAIDEVLSLFLHSLAAQQIAAAVKFVPLGQTAGQQVLARLGPVIAGLVPTLALAPLSALGNACLGADLAQMRHETLDVRIFRS